MKIKNTDLLTPEVVKRHFQYHSAKFKNSGFYFSEIFYDNDDNFYDLYIRTDRDVISQDKIRIFNNINRNIEEYINKIEAYIITTLSNAERKKKAQITNQKLTLEVLEIQENHKSYDSVLVCSKQYKYFGFLKKGIVVRLEIKDGRIISILRTKDTKKDNRNSNG